MKTHTKIFLKIPLPNLLAGIACCGILACSTLEHSYQKQYCDYDSAFKQGVRDARAGRSVDPAIDDQCPSETQKRVREGYRDGYFQTHKQELNPVEEEQQNLSEEENV